MSIQYAVISSPMLSIGPRQDERNRDNYFGIVFIHQGLFGISSGLLTFFAVLWSGLVVANSGISDLALPISVAVLTSQFQDFLRRYAFLTDHPILAFVGDLGRYLIQLVALIVFLSFRSKSGGVELAIWGMVAGAVGGVLIGLMVLPKPKWPNLDWRQITVRHWHFSKWLAAAAILTWITANAFQLAAASLLGVAAVGALRAGQAIIGAANVLLLGSENVLPRRAAIAYASGGYPRLASFTLKGMIVLSLGTLLIGAFACLFAEPLLTLLYGKDFSSYSFVVYGYTIVYIIVALETVVRAALRALERTFPMLVSRAVGAGLAIVSAYYLTAQFGLVGNIAADCFVDFVLFIIVSASFLLARPQWK
jgi:O-antigen/teichoic acid export membrane protein